MFQMEAPADPQADRRERVADEVRAHMARQKLSAAKLSATVGIPKATLSRKLNGKTPFLVDELMSICDVLDVDMTDLLRDAA
jgi:DNA-binding Xre family transcriptional regulator